MYLSIIADIFYPNLRLQTENQPEFVERIVLCLAWYYSSKEISFEKLEEFIKSIVVEEPDPEVVQEIFEKYCDAINKTGTDLEKKVNPKKGGSA